MIVDIQEKLVRAMHAREEFLLRAQQLVQGARVLESADSVHRAEPERLGVTVPEIAGLPAGSAADHQVQLRLLRRRRFPGAPCRPASRRNVLMAGIETHVCVYQTALELLARGYHVEVVADACSSRTRENKQIGLEQDACRRRRGDQRRNGAVRALESRRGPGSSKKS
ncbi:MAG: isochorismatase family protein [Desulfosudis oleivorans]|nr:isochorismatase family protein [Desulfosudis oleivorans]